MGSYNQSEAKFYSHYSIQHIALHISPPGLAEAFHTLDAPTLHPTARTRSKFGIPAMVTY